MHNSFTLRSLIRQTNNDPLRIERRNPHRGIAPDPAAVPGADAFLLAGAWTICCTHPDRAVAVLLEEDLADFLGRMGVRAGDERRITVALAQELGARHCRLTCTPEGITVEGGDIAGLWAGVTWLEWEMRTRRGPILPAGTFLYQAAWAEQISQGPWGGNYSVPDFSPEYLSDDAFRLYAHYGVNRMMIYGDLLCYVDSAILPELNHPDAAQHIAVLRDAAQRAARYGVQFMYVVVGPKLRPHHPVFQAHPAVKGAGVEWGDSGRLHFLCGSEETVRAFYAETLRRLFREVPELGGVNLILYSESFYHCRIWDSLTKDPCPRCAAADPHAMVAAMVRQVNEGVKTAQPAATVAAWIYTWQRGDRRDLFRLLPPDVALFHHIEKDGAYPRDGYTKLAWDYSIDCIGPSAEMHTLADFAHNTGRPLFIKTETGIGLEVFQFPYVPAMPHLADKWQAVRALHPQGVQQSWLFFGMFGSRAEELGLWATYRPELSRDAFLQRMAARDFGPSAVALVMQSWQAMSRAVQHLPSTVVLNYYVGPTYLGVAHPLLPHSRQPIPDIFSGYLFYLQEGEETFSVKHADETKTCLAMPDLSVLPTSVQDVAPGENAWDIIAREYAAAACEAEEAWRLIAQSLPLAHTAADRQALQEEIWLTELVYRTFLACAHVVRFLQARQRYEETGAEEAWSTMRQIAELERANALAALPIYQHARWLDLCERTDGKFTSCVTMITEKVAVIDQFLREGHGDGPL